MSERGVFAVDRGVFDHPLFESDEPFCRLKAWLWLLKEASFKPRQKRIGSAMFNLERGQLVCSLRFIAQAWRWDKNKVSRFLAELENETMIGTQTGHEGTVITICNYDSYQKVSLPKLEENGTPNGTRTGHERDKLERNKNIKEDIRGERAGASQLTEGSKGLADAFYRALGFSGSGDPAAEPYGADTRAVMWEADGYTEQIITACARRIGRGKPWTYYEKAFATDLAKLSAPLPKVEIIETPTVRIFPNAKPRSAIIQAADDLCRKLASFDGPTGEDDEIRGGSGQAPPRLLPYR